MYDGAPIGASPVSFEFEGDFHAEKPHPLTVEEIEEIVDKFASAAVRAQKGGIRRRGHQCGKQPPAAQFLLSFLEQAHRTTTAEALKTGPALRWKSSGRSKSALGNDFPVSVIMNGVEMGQVIGVPR